MFCEVVGIFGGVDFPIKGLRIIANSLPSVYVTEPLQETIGLVGCLFCVFRLVHRIWENGASLVHFL